MINKKKLGEFPRNTLAVCLVALLVAAGVGTSMIRTAQADPWDRDGWREHEWREHEWREHEWREHEWRERQMREQQMRMNPGYGYGYAQPVYTPPPVYYTPQPSPGINLVVPLNFR